MVGDSGPAAALQENVVPEKAHVGLGAAYDTSLHSRMSTRGLALPRGTA
jgi:hypothetical protein